MSVKTTYLRMGRPCQVCFGSGKQQIVFRDYGGERYACEADYGICPKCKGTGWDSEYPERKVM